MKANSKEKLSGQSRDIFSIFCQHSYIYLSILTFSLCNNILKMNNIYYVGRRNFIERETRSIKPLLQKNETHYRSNSRQETSVSSSRKTEPKYAHLSVKNERSRKYYRVNTQVHSPSRVERSHKVVIQRSDKKKSHEACSSIEMVSKIRFNKTYQANLKENPLLIKVLDYKESFTPKTHRKCENLQTEHKNQDIRQSFMRSEYQRLNNISQQHSESSQGIESQLHQMYKIQPNRKLFLCDSCLLYLPIIEVRSHFMQCKHPKTHEDYLDRWNRLTQLLQELNLLHSSNQTYKLASFMQSYAISQPKSTQSSLYSQQLNRILRYRLLVQIDELHIEQLFDILQKIGDKLQTTQKLPSFWRFCS